MLTGIVEQLILTSATGARARQSRAVHRTVYVVVKVITCTGCRLTVRPV
jgi:hypothetical protein